MAGHAGRGVAARITLPRAPGIGAASALQNNRKTEDDTHPCLSINGFVGGGGSRAGADPQPRAAEDSSLTWKGITLYGIVDMGLQYDTHSAPFSDYFPAGSASIIQKNDYDSATGLSPSNLSQSRIGLSGLEPLLGDWAGVFNVETFFNPQSGDISDALKSVV